MGTSGSVRQLGPSDSLFTGHRREIRDAKLAFSYDGFSPKSSLRTHWKGYLGMQQQGKRIVFSWYGNVIGKTPLGLHCKHCNIN